MAWTKQERLDAFKGRLEGCMERITHWMTNGGEPHDGDWAQLAQDLNYCSLVARFIANGEEEVTNA